MSKKKKGCDYQGSHFGAFYDDACCIDGYLWDLDSGDNGMMDSGGDIPCPQCNTKEYVEYIADEIIEFGYKSFNKSFPKHRVKNPFNNKMPTNMRRMVMKYWRQGRKDALREALADG